jgi:phytoene desaturase
MAPSSLLYYLGVRKRLPGLQHHNLFFDAPFATHADALYKRPDWPSEPLMYVCAPSKTDNSVAPEGCENLFVLIPVAPGMDADEATRAKYLDIAISRIESRIGTSLRDDIIYQRSYAGSDFISDYNAFMGNAYGLANTLRQTALLKPSIRNKRLRNLFYAGQLTVPGPGVPPAIISGEIAAKQALRQLNIQPSFTTV